MVDRQEEYGYPPGASWYSSRIGLPPRGIIGVERFSHELFHEALHPALRRDGRRDVRRHGRPSACRSAGCSNCSRFSWQELDTAPALMFLAMATTMTVPMIGWMAYRGHSRRAKGEMSASMFRPTFAVIALLGGGVLTDIGVLLVIEHVAMLAGMLAVMLLRPADTATTTPTRPWASRPSRRRREQARMTRLSHRRWAARTGAGGCGRCAPARGD